MGARRTLLATLAIIVLSNLAFAQVPSYIPTNGLVGWWPFNGDANDESGSGNNGTVNGALTLTSDRFGSSNSAYSWPNSLSSSNYIDLGTLPQLSPDRISISCWVWFDAATSNSRVISSGEPGIIVNSDIGSTVTIKCSYAASGSQVWPSTFAITKYEWHHILFTSDYNAGEAALYIDGVLTDTGINNAPLSTTTTWNIGRKSISGFDGFGGLIDDIGIWDRALSQQEITGLFSGTPASPCRSQTPVSLTGLDASYTTTDGIVELIGVPAGGIFIGPGVSGSTFDPGMAGVGTHSVTYTYVDVDGCINTAGLCTTVDLGEGINGNEMSVNGNVRVYPNPNAGQFTLETELSGLVSLQVFDVKGQLVQNEVFNGNGTRNIRLIDLSRFAKGTYSLRVQNAGSTVVQTVVVK